MNLWFKKKSADGHFGIKILEAKPKSDTRKRSVSDSINLVFRLDQRSWDKPSCSFMFPIMETISQFLMCNLITYKINNSQKELREILSLSVSSINKLEFIINYFNKYPLLGIKGKDFKDWETVYYILLSKQDLTEAGRLKIISIRSNMNTKRNI